MLPKSENKDKSMSAEFESKITKHQIFYRHVTQVFKKGEFWIVQREAGYESLRVDAMAYDLVKVTSWGWA